MRPKVLFAVFAVLSLVGVSSAQFGSASALLKHSRKVCTTNPPVGVARCHAIILTDGSGVTPLSTTTPKGYGPAAFRAAYGVHSGAATNVGIVVAYDAPTIASDLTVFSKTFGLPSLPVCTSVSQSSCFVKFNQRGGSTLPATNSSWAVEASLDVESVHGMCSGCRISLIEADSSSLDNLSAAVDVAVARGAKVISNSYGSSESSGEAVYDRHYRRAGVAMVASSGDSGFGTNYPAASPYVVAVGGTTLRMNGSRVTSETAWNGAGSGCSQFEYKSNWQHDKKCVMRSIADVAADADPTTGAAIYDSYPSSGHSGWFTVGGTSLAGPLVAGMLANSGATSNQPAYLYNNAPNIIRDIISGTNGSCANYLCKASAGYDGPTGLGVLSRL